MKCKLAIFFILIVSQCAYAQYRADYKSAANKAFASRNYFEAAYFYNKYLSARKNIKDADVVYYNLADAYRLYDNYTAAQVWYQKLSGNKSYPLAKLWNGVCLRADGHFDAAIEEFTQFITLYPNIAYTKMARRELERCRFAIEQYRKPQRIAINRVSSFISEEGNYAVAKSGEEYYFTSSRYFKDKKHRNRIYVISERALVPQLVDLAVNDGVTNDEYGMPALDAAGKHIYFTRWYKSKGLNNSAIYVATRQNEWWSTPVKLNAHVNAMGFNALQPFITRDGTQLYFATDKPGGRGGYDIWIAKLNSNGQAEYSVNAGSVINSEYDEQSPYYDAVNKKLFYSSTGFIGLGGFDIFESQNTGNKWLAPQNLGYPVNSTKDDMYYMRTYEDGNSYYFSSDRESDCCFGIFEGIVKQRFLAGQVIDCDTDMPLTDVSASIIYTQLKQPLQQFTNAAGNYIFTVDSALNYTLKLEKEGYLTKIIPVNLSATNNTDTLLNTGICLQAFKINQPVTLQGILFDFDKAILNTAAKAILDKLVITLKDNAALRIEIAAYTDAKGSDLYNARLSQARANACVNYLVLNGISVDRISAGQYGESDPVAPNAHPDGRDNPRGRQLNRRIEIKFSK